MAPQKIYNQSISDDLILDGEDKKYVLKLRDLPADQKPREKLLKYGPSNSFA